ncbi:MAG: hypothetical protein IK115_03430 [Lachnospiraceae bacterium]|nr:hypothetical protein [Lachnospiraceae bacterium]
MIPFRYLDGHDKEQSGIIRILSDYDPIEMEVEANGWSFHVLVGEHQYGRYICIPDWSIGSEYSSVDDEFWNIERLKNNTELHPDNVAAVVRAVAVAGEWIRKYHSNECG